MPIVFHGSGVEFLIRNLEKLCNNEPLSTSDIDEILTQPDIIEWINAYDPWIENVRDTIVRILESLHLDACSDLDQWGSRIDFGLRTAVEDFDRMKSSIEILSDIDWSETEKNTLKYLPLDTPLDSHLYLTIDGFNGGMNRGNKTFLSLVFIDPSTMNPAHFTHEFHHSGFGYWWKMHPLVKAWWDKENTQEFWTLALFQYLVSEGLANAYCSPRAIAKIEGTGSVFDIHNATVDEYESSIADIFRLLESIIDAILADKSDNAKELYEQFSMDMSGRGLPRGHFLSGRMIQTIEQSTKISHEQIIELARNPFNIFHYYNTAASEQGLIIVNPDLIENLDALLRRMSTS